MKATGIVRRIDDLGRVVIPKEIRRTLRIREGDPLEIYTNSEGGIVLMKYSPIAELGDFAKEYAESLNKSSGFTACITDRSNIIAISGESKKDYLEKPLSQEIEKILEDRSKVYVKEGNGKIVSIVADEAAEKKCSSQVITPIIAEGDAIGTVIIFSTDPSANVGDIELKLAETAAGFLGRQMEQ